MIGNKPSSEQGLMKTGLILAGVVEALLVTALGSQHVDDKFMMLLLLENVGDVVVAIEWSKNCSSCNFPTHARKQAISLLYFSFCYRI